MPHYTNTSNPVDFPKPNTSERILQLANECFVQPPDPKDLQKFTLAIVEECLHQVDKIRDGCENDGEDEQALGADWAGIAIARYFGIG